MSLWEQNYVDIHQDFTATELRSVYGFIHNNEMAKMHCWYDFMKIYSVNIVNITEWVSNNTFQEIMFKIFYLKWKSGWWYKLISKQSFYMQGVLLYLIFYKAIIWCPIIKE